MHPLGQTRLQRDAGYDLKLRYPGNQSSINYAPVQAHRSIQTATYLLSTSFLPNHSSFCYSSQSVALVPSITITFNMLRRQARRILGSTDTNHIPPSSYPT